MIDLKVDKSKMICRKLLSDAEVLHRRAPGTGQTHIGLYVNSVTLDRAIVPSLLFYLNESFDTLTLMDPITNPDGSKRSPKTRQGKSAEESFYNNVQYETTFAKINKIILKEDEYLRGRRKKEFFIIWGTLENGRLFFVLYHDNDPNINLFTDHLEINEVLSKSSKGYPGTDLHKKLASSVEKLLKRYNDEETINESLELIKSNISSKRYLTETESKFAQKIGQQGEDLIAKYLHEKKNKNEIQDYFWLSKINPGADHDFEITNLKGEIEFIEVKSTINAFKTPFYWSKNERRLFINNSGNYTIKRVSNVFKKNKAFFCSGQNMHTLKEKLVIPGIAFNGATVYPNKIDIKWEEKIYLKNFF